MMLVIVPWSSLITGEGGGQGDNDRHQEKAT